MQETIDAQSETIAILLTQQARPGLDKDLGSEKGDDDSNLTNMMQGYMAEIENLSDDDSSLSKDVEPSKDGEVGPEAESKLEEKGEGKEEEGVRDLEEMGEAEEDDEEEEEDDDDEDDDESSSSGSDEDVEDGVGKCNVRQERTLRQRSYRQGQRMSTHRKTAVKLCLFLTVCGLGNSQEVQCGCHEEVYFERGDEGVIPCGCDGYALVSWYTSEKFDISNGSPFITYNTGNNVKTGGGYTSGDFDVERNGSLIIKDVDLSHSHDYVVVFLRQSESRQDISRVNVEVLVPPHRVFALVNGKAQEKIYNYVKRDGELSCTMLGIYPPVNLTWTVIDGSPSSTLQFQPGIQKSTQNEDGTFDVSYISHYTADLDATVSVIACQITGQISQYLQALKEVVLLYSPVISTPPVAATPSLFPVIDGCYSKQDNCVLEVKKTGSLTCTVKNSPLLVDLRWKTLGGDPSQLVFEEDKGSTQYNTNCMSITTPYTVKDELLTVMTIQCDVIEQHSASVLSTAKVSLVISSDDDSVCSDSNSTIVLIYAMIFMTMLAIAMMTLMVWCLCGRRSASTVTVSSIPI